jgi:cytochrome c553
MYGIAMMIFAVSLPLAGSALASPVGDLGMQIAGNGNGKGAAACETCHGVSGLGNAAAGFPRLAGLEAAYLVRQLNDYENGTRSNPVMTAMARTLSPEDRSAVAAYYAALPVPRQGVQPGTDPTVLVRGQRIAQDGAWSKGVPACFQCHGENGQGIPPHFPAIIDQPTAYIVAQFLAWQQGTRTNDPLGLMKSVAMKLDQEEVAAAAAWLASIGPMQVKPAPAKSR